MNEVTEHPPEAKKPGSKRIYILWGVALALLLAAGLFCWLVVVPVWADRATGPEPEPAPAAENDKPVEQPLKRKAPPVEVPKPPAPGYTGYTKWPFGPAEARRRQKEAAAKLGVQVVKTVDLGGGVRLELALIPAGEFMMGSPDSETGREGSEGPLHRVRLTRPFYMGKHEVTQAVWKKVTGKNPSLFKAPRNPVEKVSWDDCQEFMKKLNALKKTRGTFRLPTEAEWEYACRAGTDTPFHFGRHASKEKANYDVSITPKGGRLQVSTNKSVRVGGFLPNAWGLFDCHGNVYEWCSDWFGESYYKNSPKENPRGPADGSIRVLRGGSFYCGAGDCRSASRHKYFQASRWYPDGLRVLLEIAGEEAK